jgi:4-amino-4-deoxy-L-arabinose transferase-like glycosyltransferase
MRVLAKIPVAYAVRFLVAPAVAALFVLAKLTGIDGRSWSVVLSAALGTAGLVVTWRLVADSSNGTSRSTVHGRDRFTVASRSGSARPPKCRYGVPVANERDGEPSPVLPLLILVIGLAFATLWFVALPALDTGTDRSSATASAVSSRSVTPTPPRR